MHRRPYVSAFSATIFSVFALTANAGAGPTPAQKCESAKNKLVGLYAACLQKAQAGLVAGGDADDYTEAVDKCAAKYSLKWQKAESAAGTGVCPSEGDETAVQDFITACVFSAQDSLSGSDLPLDVATCNTELGDCTSDLGGCNDDLSGCGDDLAGTQASLNACETELADVLCGNDVIDDNGEECEGANLDGKTCLDLDFADGTVSCDGSCRFETSSCIPKTRAVALEAGSNVTCVIRSLDGALKCWGENTAGQLGLGDITNRGDEAGEMGENLPAVDLGTGRTAVAAAAGQFHTCALLDNGSVKCWGNNNVGALGLGHTDARGDEPGEMGDNLPAVDLGTGRTAVAISAGSGHTCALLDNASIKCWGQNNGALGLGDTGHRGDEPNEMGDNLPAVDLGTGRTATSVIAGNTHNCAILDDSSLKCWGQNSSGRLGLGDTNARGDEPGEMGDALPAVQLGTGRTAVAVAPGFTHTCAVLDDGSAKCWGQNTRGELGQGNVQTLGDEPGEMGDDLAAIGLGTGRTASLIATSNRSTCARLDDGSTKCWGDNASGQLGQENTTDRGDNFNEMGDSLSATNLGGGRTATKLSMGTRHACALLDDSAVKCWGENEMGQLGQGTTDDLGNNGGEMGDALKFIYF